MAEISAYAFERWLGILIRGALILGPMTLLVLWLRPGVLKRFRVPQPREVKPLIWEEIPRTALGLSMYVIPGVIMVLLQKNFGYTRMYTDIAEYGWAYFGLSIFIFLFVTDTWFYWLHRWMHASPVLMKIHRVHHRSYNVTPAASYSFHALEAFLIMLSYVVLTLTVPWHPLALTIFGLFGIVFSGYLHSGHDAGFAWRRRSPLLRWMYSSTHHSIHHQVFDGNYSNYFTFWDWLMGTELLSSDAKVPMHSRTWSSDKKGATETP